MDDLIAAIIILLQNDGVLQTYFAEGEVSIGPPEANDPPNYPSVTITGKPGPGIPQGDPGNKFRNAELSVEVYTRDNDKEFGVDQMWLIANRVSYLIVGDKPSATNGMLNARVKSQDGETTYIVTTVRSVSPTGPSTRSADPKDHCHVATFKTQLLRQ